MPITPHAPAPYGPPSAILEVLKRYRDRDLRTPVTREVLGRIGVADSLLTRTLVSLQQLDLVDHRGMPTPTMNALRAAPKVKFPAAMVTWLNAIYAEVLRFVDPAIALDYEVRAAFRGYIPVKQQPRIVALFLGLYAAAGVSRNDPPPRGGRRISHISPRPEARGPKPPLAARVFGGTKPPPELVGLLAGLPAEGVGWTKDERDKFMTIFGTMLDYCVPLTKESGQGKKNERP
jgi:hypothetical protein